MKKIIVFFICFLITVLSVYSEEFTTGGIYVSSSSPNITCTLINKTNSTVNKLIIGKTYSINEEIMEIKTGLDETIDFTFSNDIQVRVLPESTFSIDSFNQLVLNYESQPANLKSDYFITTLTLMTGDINLICPPLNTNSQFIVQTPLVNVNVAQGRLSIRSNPKYVIINAIEGNIVVIDSKNKKNIIDKGNLGLIIPYPGRDHDIIVTQKAISDEEFNKINKDFVELENLKKEVIFTIIDKKVVGVNMK